MKLRHPFWINSAALLGSWVLRGWMRTLHVDLDYRHYPIHPIDTDKERCIYAFWHETFLFVTLFRANAHVLISQHADGELIAKVCKHIGAKTIRGSSRRGGSAALLEMLDVAKRSHILITPDGPRGPRRKIHLGVIYLASMTGLPIVPFGVAFSKCWRANSWDKFAIPYPFSTVKSVIGDKLYVPPDLDLQAMDSYRCQLETNLNTATEAAERWAAGEPRRNKGLVISAPAYQIAHIEKEFEHRLRPEHLMDTTGLSTVDHQGGTFDHGPRNTQNSTRRSA